MLRKTYSKHLIAHPFIWLVVTAVSIFVLNIGESQGAAIIVNAEQTESTTGHPDGDSLFTVNDTFTIANGSPTADISSASAWEFQRSALRFREINSVYYAEFVIVMNENVNGTTITMNELAFSSGGSSLWNLDSGEDNSVTFNENDPLVNFAAGGNSDAELAIHIPHSVFAGLSDTDTISVTYSFTAATAGPDTIGMGDGLVAIPEPSSSFLMFAGLSLFLRHRSERR